MRIISAVVPGVSCLASPPEAGKASGAIEKARQRFKWFDYYHSHTHNARLTYRYFGISPQTFYRWKRRYNPKHLQSLKDRSHRPQYVRQPAYSTELVASVPLLHEVWEL